MREVINKNLSIFGKSKVFAEIHQGNLTKAGIRWSSYGYVVL
ncbi:hypothetical protein SPLC1_S310310 [Arthrospira platensis C1]|nr:hypothetical protein SPLC1_S310310 [Arthrospira platensis C1]